MTSIRFAARADRVAARIDEWWRQHRPAAANLFADELAEAVLLLEQSPGVGVRYRSVGGRDVRRVYLLRTRYHVYYWHDSGAERVEVIAIWSAQRGHGPRLA